MPYVPLCLVVCLGCGPVGSTTPDAPESAAVALTPVTRTDVGLSFDPKSVAPGDHSFGTPTDEAVRVIMHGRHDGQCQFDYVHAEPNGAYTWRRVQVPATGGPVTISVAEEGIVTSFPLAEAAVLWTGDGTANAPGEAERKHKIPRTKQPIAGESFYENYYRDEIVGEGAEVASDNDVVIRCRVFANEYFDEPLPGFSDLRELRFLVGEGNAGSSLESAVVGMKVGGIRKIMLWEQLSDALRNEVGGWQPEKQMPVELELVEFK